MQEELGWSRNYPHLMEPEGSLACSQEATTDPYPEPDESKTHVNVPCLNYTF
jgi:hypothetical protein